MLNRTIEKLRKLPTSLLITASIILATLVLWGIKLVLKSDNNEKTKSLNYEKVISDMTQSKTLDTKSFTLKSYTVFYRGRTVTKNL